MMGASFSLLLAWRDGFVRVVVVIVICSGIGLSMAN